MTLLEDTVAFFVCDILDRATDKAVAVAVRTVDLQAVAILFSVEFADIHAVLDVRTEMVEGIAIHSLLQSIADLIR